MIQITINGQTHQFDAPLLLVDLLIQIDANSEFVAVALNGDVLDKQEYDEITIRNGDNIEIVQPVGGGSR